MNNVIKRALDLFEQIFLFLLITLNIWCLLVYAVGNFLERFTDLEGQIILLQLFGFIINPIICLILYFIIRRIFLWRLVARRIILIICLGIFPISVFLVT